MNKANAKFAAIPGGSKNTVNGRYGFALGSFGNVKGDYSGVLAASGSTYVFPASTKASNWANMLSVCWSAGARIQTTTHSQFVRTHFMSMETMLLLS